MKILKALILTSCFFLSGCEKTIKFNINTNYPELVVEATIENGEAPRVVLSHSVGYFSQITPDILSQSFVHGAQVNISDGVLNHQLKEYKVDAGNGILLYYYSTDSSQLSTAINGQLNHAYSLRIVIDNKEYDAKTHIPAITKVIDSMWWQKAPGTTDSSKVIVMVKATDPKGYGDYIRYFTKRNSESFLAPSTSAFDDQFIDGTTYTLQLEPGIDRNAVKNKDGNYFYRGDIVTLKLSNIDKATFDFWRTMEFSYQSIGNPFSTPVKVLSNISNGALGYFGGYASQYRTVIIPQ